MPEGFCSTQGWLQSEDVRMFEQELTERAAGNPGALSVMIAGIQRFGPSFMLRLRHHDLRGKDIWILAKDQCGLDPLAMMTLLQSDEPIEVKDEGR